MAAMRQRSVAQETHLVLAAQESEEHHQHNKADPALGNQGEAGAN